MWKPAENELDEISRYDFYIRNFSDYDEDELREEVSFLKDKVEAEIERREQLEQDKIDAEKGLKNYAVCKYSSHRERVIIKAKTVEKAHELALKGRDHNGEHLYWESTGRVDKDKIPIEEIKEDL